MVAVRAWLAVLLICATLPARADATLPAYAEPEGAEACRHALRPLPIAPLTVEWQQGERVRRLTLEADGTLHGERGGRVVGDCVLDSTGKVVVRVAPDGRVQGAFAWLDGRFSPTKRLDADGGNRVAVGEVLTRPEGDALGLTAGGDVWLAPAHGKAFPLPAHATGPRKARRTALLLLFLGPRWATFRDPARRP